MRHRRARLTVLFLTTLALAGCVLPPTPTVESADAGMLYPDPAAPELTDEGTAYPVDAPTDPGPVDVTVFHDSLAPYGSWIADPDYGQVWRPAAVDADWRPYTDGRWAYTTDYGWTWVAAEPWGWAPYHYGRWLFRPAAGWVWVPGSVWAPAWVDWRSGDGYLGWRPLPPRGFHDGDDPRGWCFVPERSFDAPRVVTVIAPPARNIVLIHNTVNITNYRIINQRIVNRSVNVTRIEQVTHHQVVRYQPNFAQTPRQAGGPQIVGRHLTLYRPPSLAGHPAPTRPATVPVQAGQPQQRPRQPEAIAQATPARNAVQPLAAKTAQPPIVPPGAASADTAGHRQQRAAVLPATTYHAPPAPTVRQPTPQPKAILPPVTRPVAARPPAAETHRTTHQPSPDRVEVQPRKTQPDARRAPARAAPPAVRPQPAAPAPTKRAPACKQGDHNCPNH